MKKLLTKVFIYLAVVSFSAPSTRAGDAVVRFAESTIIRSDLPLWGEADDGVWPLAFFDKNELGQKSIFALGDWRRRDGDCIGDVSSMDQCISWFRLEIYGVIHGGYVINQAYEKGGLNTAQSEPSVIAELGRAPGVNSGTMLYAIQIGFRRGSDYLLVAAPAENAIRHLSILAVDCSGGERSWVKFGYRMRELSDSARFMTGFKTDYCVVKNRDALRNLAIQALNRPPAGAMDWFERAPE